MSTQQRAVQHSHSQAGSDTGKSVTLSSWIQHEDCSASQQVCFHKQTLKKLLEVDLHCSMFWSGDKPGNAASSPACSWQNDRSSSNKLHNAVLSLKCIYITYLVHFWRWSLVSRQQVGNHAVRPIFGLALLPKGTSLLFIAQLIPTRGCPFLCTGTNTCCSARVRGTRRTIQLKIKVTFNTDFLVCAQYYQQHLCVHWNQDLFFHW